MAKGDIVLIRFPFTDLSGSKLRPAVILIEAGTDLTVCFITTQTGRQEPTDILLSATPVNGLRRQSVIRTSKIATLDKSLARGLLGIFTPSEMTGLNMSLKILFQLL